MENYIDKDPEDRLIDWSLQYSQRIVKELGFGHRENIYHKAFEIELRDAGIPYETEVIIPILYKGQQIGHGRADLIINKKIILEFKAVDKSVGSKEIKQLKKYMTFTGIKKGIIINFCKSNGVNGYNIDYSIITN